MKKIIGPFSEVLTMSGLPSRGPLHDDELEVIGQGGILIDSGVVDSVGPFLELKEQNPGTPVEEIEGSYVALPGLIDCHTHICFGGSRAADYASRNNGMSYQEIASRGGGIWDTVTKTRTSSQTELELGMGARLDKLVERGVTTVEVKSGYGLSVEEELKLLRAINAAGSGHPIDVIPTCLAAHIIPREFKTELEYLQYLLKELVPLVKEQNLAKRFDIFIEKNAFTSLNSIDYLASIKKQGFEITVHGDQFSPGGSQVAIDVGAMSVDHLEASGEKEIKALSESNTIPVVLPGASLGLGMPFSPARKLLDAGCGVAIASDWNPGSAPNGNLLTQAAILGAYEKLSFAEVFAGMTFRAANALGFSDRGILSEGLYADFIAFPCEDYREILYHQGELQPKLAWKKGNRIPTEANKT